MGYDEPGRAAVFGRKRTIVVVPRDEGLTINDVRQRHIGRIAIDGVGNDELRLVIDLDLLQQRIDADAMPARIEVRPFSDAVNIDDEILLRKFKEVRPRPRDRFLDETFNGESPLIQIDFGRWPGG